MFMQDTAKYVSLKIFGNIKWLWVPRIVWKCIPCTHTWWRAGNSGNPKCIFLSTVRFQIQSWGSPIWFCWSQCSGSHYLFLSSEELGTVYQWLAQRSMSWFRRFWCSREFCLSSLSSRLELQKTKMIKPFIFHFIFLLQFRFQHPS